MIRNMKTTLLLKENLLNEKNEVFAFHDPAGNEDLAIILK
jgi:hypothetical protein